MTHILLYKASPCIFAARNSQHETFSHELKHSTLKIENASLLAGNLSVGEAMDQITMLKFLVRNEWKLIV